jgi:hypothetical protein
LQYDRYDSIMLPPDKESSGILDYISFKKLKSVFLRSDYDESMLSIHTESVIEAMLHEILEMNKNDVRLSIFEAALNYIIPMLHQMYEFYKLVKKEDLNLDLKIVYLLNFFLFL